MSALAMNLCTLAVLAVVLAPWALVFWLLGPPWTPPPPLCPPLPKPRPRSPEAR